MEPVVIRTLSPIASYTANTLDELNSFLDALEAQFRGNPILLVMTASNGDLVLLGVGATSTTIEMILHGRTKHVRSIASLPAERAPIEFTYCGESTEVEAKHLISNSDGRSAVVAWFGKHEMDERIQWSIRDFPPRTWTKNTPTTYE